MVHALSAGCARIHPCAEIDEARELASRLHAERPLLGGERGGVRPPGFDLGNSPSEYTPEVCKGRPLVMTTTNGTRALFQSHSADHILLAAFVNLGAVCERLARETRAIHVVCAGREGEVCLDDALVAGAIVTMMSMSRDCVCNDAARLAQTCYEKHADDLEAALRGSSGGVPLVELGYDGDIKDACRVDRFSLVPELEGHQSVVVASR
jgi:2-phosphosulfolactate phosphatase